MHLEVLAVSLLLLSTCVQAQNGDEVDFEALMDPCPGLDTDDEWEYGKCEALTRCSATDECHENEACCQAGSCGKSCLPDLKRCIDVNHILLNIMDEETCLDLFLEVVNPDLNFDKYCRSLIGGFTCVAEKMIEGPYNAMCKERMLIYLKNNASMIFKEIKDYVKLLGMDLVVKEEYVNKTGTCSEFTDSQKCRPTNTDCSSDDECTSFGSAKCVDEKCCVYEELPDPPKCKLTNTVCVDDDVCQSTGPRAQCKSGKCCVYPMNSEELTDQCPGLDSDDEWKYGKCEDLTSCSVAAACRDMEVCCSAGTCGQSCLPELRRCISPDEIVKIVIKHADCYGLFQDVVSGGVEFNAYCRSLIGGLSCVAEKMVAGPYNSMCKERMFRFLVADPGIILKSVQNYMLAFGLEISVDEEHVRNTGTCPGLKAFGGEDGDGKAKDDNWNTSCPEMDYTGGLCPNDCNTDTKCPVENDVCCNVGGERCHACLPDLKQCADIDRILGQDAAEKCLKPKLDSLLSRENRARFCSDIWDIFKCSVQQIVRDDYSKLCLERMAMFVKHSPTDILKKMRELARDRDMTNIVKFARDIVTECKESPLYEQPRRPVPNDIKDCSRLDTIQQNVAQCGRITASSPTNAACGQLRALVICIADKIAAGRDEQEKRRCAGQIYKFLEENRQRLTNTFGRLDSRSCEEREYVCGDYLKPLDNMNCSTSRCPAAYVCKNSYCCPEEKEGRCPKQERGGPAMCKEKCQMDSQCEEDEKCCMSVACRYKTCMKKESRQKSQCETEYENGRKQIERQGICGDGTAITKLPNCQNTRFSPMQINMGTGRGYCVKEDGKKIPGSDFTGNTDCTKVRKGKCPAVPQACANGGKVENICQSNDFKCSDGEKCCLSQTGDLCVRMCVKAEEAPENVQDDCPDRKCCPITLCQDKKCPGDITAVCRIDSCGDCKAEFYNLTGKVQCYAGVSLCRRKRAEAQEENARKRKSDFDRIFSFLNSRDRNEREKDRTMDDQDMEREGSEMEEDDEMMTDEYGERREDKDSLYDDIREGGEDDDEEEDSMLMKEYVHLHACDTFTKMNICMNRGECKVASGESFFEFCHCKEGYYGLLCNQTGTVEPKDTQCYRDVYRIKSLNDILMSSKYPKAKMVLQNVLNKLKFPYNIMPRYSCDEGTGHYNQIQMGTLLPRKSDMININYCVNSSTGLRNEGTPVTLEKSGQLPNCYLTSIMPDPMRLPRRCLATKMENCTQADTCQYFWNQESSGCEKGKAGHGFSTLNECYDKCGIQRGSRMDETESSKETEDRSEDSETYNCEIKAGPKPCRMTESNVETDGCDYTKQFCSVEETATGHVGTCKDFQHYCLERPDSGFGEKRIGAYYFDACTRKCGKFMYKGHGGNKNRFYSLHQCQTECSTRPYKYEDIVCPVPSKLAMSRKDKMSVDMCDNDYNCHENQVCCSDDKARVCADPVQTCFSVRCSFDGACDQGKCICSDCSDTAKAEVCGSDGKTYENECHLKRHSCQTMQNITVATNGPCSKCGENQCESYQVCENNVCVSRCPDVCTADYTPVCGKGVRSGVYRSFSNECDMTRQACTLMERFIKVKDGCCGSQDAVGNCMLPYCSLEYKPLCAYDTTEALPKLITYPNPCNFKQAMMNGKKIKVLYPGKCHGQCGTTQCEISETCINNTCSCQNACTREYAPICAHSIADASNLKTFSNLCEMRRDACINRQTYVIYSHGPCKNPEPVYKCPENRLHREGSAVVSCSTETHEGCDTEMGEMCCPFGAGKTCLSKKALVRHKEMKSGICPDLYALNYDQSMCMRDQCMSDDECGGDAKCCFNNACGNMTCVEPSVKDDSKVCGANSRIVSKCAPDMRESGCPRGASCKPAMDADNKIGVCCMPNDRQDTETDLVGSMLCHLLEMSEHTCENGGTCIGDLRSGTVCQCMTGYFGYFCTDTSQPTSKATQCQTQKTVMMALNKTGLVSEDLSWGAFLRSRGNHMETEDREDNQMEEDEEMEQWTNPFMERFMQLIKYMGMSGIPQSFADLCTDDGNFRKEQCLRDTNGQQYCYCVDPHSGKPIPNGPKVTSVDQLACNDLTENPGLQVFCLSEKPSMEICSDSVIERFYYNPATMDCEIFTDYGCNENVSNNFDEYDTCKSTCGVKSTSRSICSRKNCENGQMCRVKDGSETCVDPFDSNSMFEPICEWDGNFRPKQCHGGVCVCVNEETGEPIADSEADGSNLQCLKEGGIIKAVRKETKRCNGNEVAKFCENGGDICDNCKLKENSGNRRDSDRKVNDNNVCIKCESCPAGQGGNRCSVPERYCQNKCRQFPDAECSFNTCTCKEEYKANDRVVNCAAVQSQCHIERHTTNQLERAKMVKNGGKQSEDRKQIRCTSSGAYEAECKGNVCHCLNATDGTKVGNARFNPENINCDSIQRKSKAERWNMKMTIASDKRWSNLSQAKRIKMRSKVEEMVEKRGVKVTALQFSDGSIVCSMELESCQTCGDNVETSDLSSIGINLIAEVNEGRFTFEIDGEVFVPSTASATGIVTAEELYGPVTEEIPEEDDNKTTIIIVIVVVIVVLIVAVGISCYCYKKANKSKNKDIPFTDIQGNSNPAYGKA